uniref:LCCL domain-containing protein n=1 Tax=Labrus bergylta TaxID=56723 RepID=A0A3Q3G5L4_9LABR
GWLVYWVNCYHGQCSLCLLTGPVYLLADWFDHWLMPYPVTCVTRGADLAEDGLVVLCPPDCTQGKVSVFGTGIYAAVSSVCGAAVHR